MVDLLLGLKDMTKESFMGSVLNQAGLALQSAAALLGLRRGLKGRPAGLKTFSLVCIGATMVMVTNEYIIESMYPEGAGMRPDWRRR